MPEQVLVLAEAGEGKLTRLTLELMGLGARLARERDAELEAVLLGSSAGAGAGELASLGARRVYSADCPSLDRYSPDECRSVLEGLLEGRPEVLLLAGHTSLGQDLLPRLAFALRAGLVTDCVGIELEPSTGELLFIKPVFGGNALASNRIITPVRLATVRPRVGTAAPPVSSAAPGEIVPMEVSCSPPKVRALSRGKEDRGVRLEDSRVVVSGGRGIGGEEGFGALEELARVLGGAVGASRPPCDFGWAPASAQVGITGKVVAPDLYIAVAISGSSQHLSGISESGRIIAINQDPEAYIFKVSDYGAVGDWRRVLPAFTGTLREHAGP